MGAGSTPCAGRPGGGVGPTQAQAFGTPLCPPTPPRRTLDDIPPNTLVKEHEMHTHSETKTRAQVPWRHVAAFVALAYGITWSVWASVMPDAWHALMDGRTPSAYTMPGLGMLGMFGPALAALVMRLFITKEGMRGSLGARRNWRYYAIA